MTENTACIYLLPFPMITIALPKGARRTAGWLGLSFMLLGRSARADGVPAFLDADGWRPLGERAQHAVIVWHDGHEQMVLQITLASLAPKADRGELAWITPVPASPAEVEARVVEGRVTFRGHYALEEAADRALDALGIMGGTQLWTLPWILPTLFHKHDVEIPTTMDPIDLGERDGVTVEVLPADSLERMRQRLAQVGGRPFEGSVLDVLKPYVGDQRSFVLYRVTNLANARLAADRLGLGLFLAFPTGVGEFPLVANSGLPGERLDVVVTVLGFHHAMGPIPLALTTDYFVGACDAEVSALPAICSGEFRFTTFQISGAPSSLAGDLRFADGAPLRTRAAAASIERPAGHCWRWVAAWFVFSVLSMASHVAAGPIWNRGHRPSWRRMAVFGLLNSVTVIGPLIASLRFARFHGMARLRAVLFVAASSVVLVCLVMALAMMVSHSIR